MDESHNPTDEEISLALVGNEAEIVCAIEQVSKQYGHYLACVVYRHYGRNLDEHDVTEAVSRTLQALRNCSEFHMINTDFSRKYIRN